MLNFHRQHSEPFISKTHPSLKDVPITEWKVFEIFKTVRDTDTLKFIGFKTINVFVACMEEYQAMDMAKDFLVCPVLREFRPTC